MSKLKRRPLLQGGPVPFAVWFLVTFELNFNAREVQEAYQNLEHEFNIQLGRIVPWRTIQRQYLEVSKLLRTDARAAGIVQGKFSEIAQRRKSTKYTGLLEGLELLGYDFDTVLQMMPPEAELKIRKGQLVHLQAKIDEVNLQIDSLSADHDTLVWEKLMNRGNI